MKKKTEDTFIRIHRPAKHILDRYAKTHHWKLIEFLDALASTIENCLDGIDNPDWTLEDLRRFYAHSDLVCVQDVRQIFEPNKPCSPKTEKENDEIE